jgi:hypothetical protein
MKKVIFGEQNVKNVVNNLIAAQRGVCVVAFVPCDSKLDKTHKDMVGRILKCVVWCDRPLVSYGGNVNAKSDVAFVPKEKKGYTYTQYPYFAKANKSGIEYLIINYRECDKPSFKDETYFIDGVEVTKDVAKSYFKEEKHYAPQTQIAVGVTNPKEQTKVVQYQIDNVAYIGTCKEDAQRVFQECRE